MTLPEKSPFLNVPTISTCSYKAKIKFNISVKVVVVDGNRYVFMSLNLKKKVNVSVIPQAKQLMTSQ